MAIVTMAVGEKSPSVVMVNIIIQSQIHKLAWIIQKVRHHHQGEHNLLFPHVAKALDKELWAI
jgi:hypothetical protein